MTLNWQTRIQNWRTRLQVWHNHWRVFRLARQIAGNAVVQTDQAQIVFFNATARLGGLSQNAAFAQLSAWGLHLAGYQVKHFVCRAGMSHCVLGTGASIGAFGMAGLRTPPPCQTCIRQSRRLYTGADVHWFAFQQDDELAAEIIDLNVAQLATFKYSFEQRIETTSENKERKKEHRTLIPLGALVLPATRWALRRHTLVDDEDTRYLLRQYILSAYHIAREFASFLDENQPALAVIFNGTMYPEAAARWVAQERRMPVITHEVGFQRYSAFFTYGESTVYPIQVPEDFELSAAQNARLDEYLSNRFQGKFSMAGIRFWPKMRSLDEAFLEKAKSFRQIVPVFTNVAYDTSQAHAHTIFPHMFAWLDDILTLIDSHPETLFVIRAHPDEMRSGTAKLSRESVQDWVRQNGVEERTNVVFIDPLQYISSYELIQRSKFVMVYNSSIGMEATLMDKAVLCAGRSRYTLYHTRLPMVFFPQNVQTYRQTAEEFLNSDGDQIDIPRSFKTNARRFLYYQLFRASLRFEQYLEQGYRKGYVRLRPFQCQALRPENAAVIQILKDGIEAGLATSGANASHTGNTNFLWPEEV
jgi:hypothetical protein